GGLVVHALRVEPDLGARRAAPVADPHGVADRRRQLAFLRRRAGLGQPADAPFRQSAMTGAVLTPGNAALILFGLFFALMLLRVPIAFALGLACLPIMIIEPRLDAQTLVQETFNAYNSFILLA